MGRLSPGLMESARWLQLAEMEEAESRPPCSGEMEKSACGCGGTALGLLRMLITCGERPWCGLSSRGGAGRTPQRQARAGAMPGWPWAGLCCSLALGSLQLGDPLTCGLVLAGEMVSG